MVVKKLRSSRILQSKRLDSKYFLNQDALLSQIVESIASDCSELGLLADVFNPPIFKRQFCRPTKRAVMYCQSSDVSNAIEGSKIYINKAHAESVNSVVEQNQILITGFGKIGDLKIVNDCGKGIAYANNVCRVEVKNVNNVGHTFAFLASKYGRAQLNKNASGSVVRYIEAPGIRRTLIPNFSRSVINKTNELIAKSTALREEFNRTLKLANQKLFQYTGLPPLSSDDYDYFGFHPSKRIVSTFSVENKLLSSTTLHAFNYSEKIRRIIEKITTSNKYLPLQECLDDRGLFSTGGFPRLEINSPKSVMLINQSDIFSTNINGKLIARKYVKDTGLVGYGEVLIAGVGTLGENESFCQAVFANEELQGQLISGEFIRMNTNKRVPCGYLFAWLSSEYGFRLIRSTHSGTKLCRPINSLLRKIPVPIIADKRMEEIHTLVLESYSKKHRAMKLELDAIRIIENSVESWPK